jgi:UDP-3-O-[3-hydroxymyristoyl] glucosamine N-acyltransferase
MNEITLENICQLFPEALLFGAKSHPINKVVGISEASGQDCFDAASWVSDKISDSIQPESLRLGLLILTAESHAKLQMARCNFLVVNNPRACFFKLLNVICRIERHAKVENSAVLHPSLKVGQNCYLGHNVVVEENCTFGNNVVILHNTVVMAGTSIGDDVIIGCNNTIGNYGFGYEKDESGDYEALQHIGGVVIGNKVEIHNNTCIDRGVLGNTEIHDNVKIDNLVHIAHGVVIERNSLIIANAMIGGSTRIGPNCWIAPSVSVINKATVAADTMTGIGAVILKSTDESCTYIGNPAIKMEEYRRWSAIRKVLMAERVGG